QEEAPAAAPARRASLSGLCYLSMGLLVLLLGLVFASMYVYRYFVVAQLPRESVFHCGVLYEDPLSSPLRGQLELREDVRIYLEENYEHINVPVPQFGGSDPADIIHDFQRGLTAYHDLALDKCYVIELNTTVVMPPRNLWELLVNVKKGDFPGSLNLWETLWDVSAVPTSVMMLLQASAGCFKYLYCCVYQPSRNIDRSVCRRQHRREAGSCHRIRHFENTFVVETVICKKS
ncbi:Integral membrane protein 2C, partial [Tinamus guttatus]